jgi:hypothetical protein
VLNYNYLYYRKKVTLSVQSCPNYISPALKTKILPLIFMLFCFAEIKAQLSGLFALPKK